MEEYTMKDEVARGLLSIKAVFLRPDEPFTWASGIKSPIYCDNRLVLSAPEVREIVESGIAETVKKYYPEAKSLMGTSTAGIAHAAIAAYKLDIPMGYVRGKAKDHGRNNQIEGRLEPGDKVVVIEDLISTAGSAIECVEALREAGMDSRIREKAFIKIKIMTVFTPRDTVFLIRRMVKRYSHSMPYMKWSHRVLRVQAMINSARPAARARKGVIFER